MNAIDRIKEIDAALGDFASTMPPSVARAFRAVYAQHVLAISQLLAPKPAAPQRPAPIVNPATGESAANFPTEEPEVSDGNVA